MRAAQREDTASRLGIRIERGPTGKAGELVDSDILEGRHGAGMLVVVNKEAVFRVHADHRSGDFQDARDRRELVTQNVRDLFFEVLILPGVLRSERCRRESVPHEVDHGSFRGAGESGGEGFEACNFKLFLDRRAETWRVCEVDQLVDVDGQGYDLQNCSLEIEGVCFFVL